MTSVEQLQSFYPFSADVLNRVNEVAEFQNRYSFSQLADHYGISNGPEIVPASETHKAYEVLTLRPKDDYDPEEARVYHLPVACPIDPNMTMRGLRTFEADPSKQLVMVGNPGAVGLRYGKLRFEDMHRVWSGDLTPVVDPLLSYMSKLGIKRTEELGFSYGADTAAASSSRAEAHDISVSQGVYMESAAAVRRGPGLVGAAGLGIDFMSAADELENYVSDTNSPPLNEARELSDVGLTRYLLGLTRPSNICIANALAHNGFEGRVRSALARQPDMRATIVWGTASELTDDTSMREVVSSLRQTFDPERVGSMAINGMHHAGGDQIDLHAAIVLQALSEG